MTTATTFPREPRTPARRLSAGAEAVVAAGITKSFGGTKALDGLDLRIPAGTICGVLGPNGAGKTTAVRVLTTLLLPDAGTARVAGYDVVRDADAVRFRIGLAGQSAALDEKISGRDNLRMFGRLYHLPRTHYRQRADELLERFDLSGAADRLVKTYSGGMRRRLDLAASLVIAPPVLFLDEPTTGLDPRSRGEVWASIRALVDDGTTVLLTTQYLDEADQLADSIAVIDAGRVVASGTPVQLKSRIGGAALDVVVPAGDVAIAAATLARLSDEQPYVDDEHTRVSVRVREPRGVLASAVRALDERGVEVEDIGLRPPTLDEVFLQLTGHSTGELS